MTDARAVWMLACGQMLSYACLFYIFAALILYWRVALPWGDGVLALGLTLAVVISAGLAPFAGRAVDRGQVATLMSGGAAIGALSLVMLATATHPAAYLVAWAGLGVAQAASLYEPCFALMIRRFGTNARQAITKVTLVGGFASTLAFPAAAALAEAWGWRVAVWAAVAVMCCLVLPLNLFAARHLARDHRAGRATSGAPAGPAWHRLVFTRPFLELALVFSLVALGHWMVVAFLRPVLDETGVDPALAVTAAAMIGPSQVAGRLVLMAGGRRIGNRAALFATLAGYVLAPMVLLLAGVAVPLVLVFALLQGAANGVITILRPLLVAETLGEGAFGTVAGLLSIPTLMASAVAPILGAGLMAAGGSMTLLLAVLACMCLALTVALLRSAR